MPSDDPADTLDDGPEQVRGRFPGLRIDRRIAAGGSGVVFRAWSEARRGWVALKVLRAGGWASEAQIRRFRREIEVHRRLDDPGVVQIYEDGTSEDGAPWLTMELIEGPSLQDRLERGALPPLRDRVGWVLVLGLTLARIHRRGVFHRDIKPSNVLISEGNDPLLADFGVVMTEAESRLTVGTAAVGTPRYMAPEQRAGRVGDWARVDQYALGLLLGELAEHGESAPDADLRWADLEWIVSRATHQEPGARYPDLTALTDDLQRWLAGRTIRWRAQALLWSLWERPRRRVSITTVGIGIMLVILLISLIRAVYQAHVEATTAADWSVARARLVALWEAGDADGAEQWVRRFADDPARHNTAATGEAWLDLAALHHGGGPGGLSRAERTAGERDALAHALAASDDASVQKRAIEALIDVWRRMGRWSALDRLLAAELPVTVDPALRREAAVDLALAAGAIDEARALLPVERAALLDPFAETAVFPNSVWGGLDSDGDGRIEWIQNRDPVAAAAPPARDGDRWWVDRVVRGATTLSDRRHVLLGGQDLWALSATGAARIGPGMSSLAALGGRLVGVRTGSPHALVELRGSDDGVPVSPTRQLRSYVTGLATGDVDGDGVDELVIGQGPPHGFLVRVSRADGTILSQRRLGFVSGVLVLPGGPGQRPRVIASISHENPSALLFGDVDPYGGACRLEVLTLEGDVLVPTQTLPWPVDACDARGLYAADLDGDGRDEVLLNRQNSEIVVLRQTESGTLEQAFVLPGFHVMQVLQADEDAADELLLEQRGMPAAERRHWVIGVRPGQTPLAAPNDLPRTAWPPWSEEPGDDVSALFQRLSLDAQAAEILQQRRAYARAARLWVRAGQPGQAAAALAEDARQRLDPAALRDALRLALTWPDAELVEVLGATADTLADAGVRLPDGLEPARIRSSLSALRAPDWRLDAGRSLEPGLQQLFPAAIRHDLANGELRVSVPSGVGTVLRLPLRSTGAQPWVRIVGDWLRAEWGSTVDIAVRPQVAPDGRAMGLRLKGVGAGGVLFRDLGLLLNPTPSGALLRGADRASGGRARVGGPEVLTRFDLRIGGTGDPAAFAVLGSSEVGAVALAGPAGAPPAVGEAWELVIEGGRGWDAAPGQLAVIVVRALEIGGFTLVKEPSPPRSPVVDWAQTGASTRLSLSGAPADDPQFIGLARLDPSWVDRVAAAWGPAAAAELFAAAWASSAYAHRADPLTVSALLAAPLLDPRTAAWLELGAAQGEARLRVGRMGEARSQLLAVVEASRDPARWEDGAAWRVRLDAAALLGELALADGDEAGALRWVNEAIAAAPDRDLGQRLVHNRPRFAARLGQPGWEMLGG